jgi:uncharacterized protein YkwD
LRFIILLIIFLSLPVSALAAPGTRSEVVSKNTATDSYCLGTRERQLLEYVNDYRAEYGLRPLVVSQTLGAAARHHALSMAKYNYFDHYLIPEDRTWGDNIRRHGYPYSAYLGENIAAGNLDPYATFMQWKNSPSHNANMLGDKWIAIGIGRSTNYEADWDHYWVQTFASVLDTKAVWC